MKGFRKVLLYFIFCRIQLNVDERYELSAVAWKQCCQLSNFVAKFSNFSDYPVNFFLRKHLATNLSVDLSAHTL